MEKAFLQDRLTKNPYQDPMGNDCHQGLERWLDKFHQPGVPNYTIITDPEYYVFLWFHDSIGNLIQCPYTEGGWLPLLEKSAPDYEGINWRIWGEGGIQSGTDDTWLDPKCIDLTPFVRQAQLPEIKPAGAEQIKTLFGMTTAGAFSPYASDGQQSITLQVVDTEMSILDSLFYPWMKDINSPWWYRPDRAYTEWATPYPMATLEIQRPRMRYLNMPDKTQSRKDPTDYTYYSYKFIGVKPTSYAPFEVNGGGVSNLTRSLTLICDMCLVDLTGDVAGSGSGSTNLGNRTGFIFSQAPSTGSGEQPDQEEEMEEGLPTADEQLAEMREQQRLAQEQQMELEQEIEQQEEGDQPGEDESEWEDKDDPDYNENEYEDPFGDGESQDEQMDVDEEANGLPDPEYDPERFGDEPEAWQEDMPSDADFLVDDPNSAMNNATLDADAGADEIPGDVLAANEAHSSSMDVGQEVAQAASTEGGWTSDQTQGSGEEPSLFDKAIGGAVDLAKGVVGLATDAVTGAVDLATGAASKLLGAVGSLASAAFGSSSPATAATQTAQATGQQQTQPTQQQRSSGGILSTIGNALTSALSRGNTVFGAVMNSPSAQNQHSTSLGGIFNSALSSAFTSAGTVVGQSSNVVGGVMKLMNSQNPVQANDAMRQIWNAKSGINNNAVMAAALNTAGQNMLESLGPVGQLASSVIGSKKGGKAAALGALGGLVSRMLTTNSAKPTPLEGFVGMVTKQNARGSSMA